MCLFYISKKMKTSIPIVLLVAISLFLSFSAIGRPSRPVIFFLNQTQVDFDRIFISPHTIDSIYVSRSGDVGRIFIRTKDREFYHHRLSDILRNRPSILRTGNLLVFRINNRLVPDTAGVKIDKAYGITVTTEKFENVENLPESFRRITLVNIELNRRETAQLSDVTVELQTDDFAPIIWDFWEHVIRRRPE